MLVHLLNVVMLFVQHMLRFRQKSLINFMHFSLHLTRWQLMLPHSIRGFLTVDAGTGASPLLENLLLLHLVVLLFLLIRNNTGGGFDTEEVGCSDNCAHRILILFSFASDSPNISHIYYSDVIFLSLFPLCFEKGIIDKSCLCFSL